MRTEQEILDRLAEIEQDERFRARPAKVFSNAPLALIQTDLHAKVEMLNWVLDAKPS